MDLEDIMQGKPMSIRRALDGTNPNRDTSTEYDFNCQKCVQVYEYRRRGYDVEALPFFGKSDIIVWGNECFVDKNGHTPSWDYGRTQEDIMTILAAAPKNSRFFIHVEWADGRGTHVFVADKSKGKINFIDPQSGESDVSKYFSEGVDDEYGILRVDDKALTSDIDIISATMK